MEGWEKKVKGLSKKLRDANNWCGDCQRKGGGGRRKKRVNGR